jgi:hypothetical protein
LPERRVQLDRAGNQAGERTHGDVSKTGVKKIWVDAGAGIDDDAFRCKALGAVAGNSVAVVEMAMLSGIEFDLPVIVETGRDPAVRRYRFDGGKVAVGDAKRLVWSGELDSVADGKLPYDFSIQVDAAQSTWIAVG